MKYLSQKGLPFAVIFFYQVLLTRLYISQLMSYLVPYFLLLIDLKSMTPEYQFSTNKILHFFLTLEKLIFNQMYILSIKIQKSEIEYRHKGAPKHS